MAKAVWLDLINPELKFGVIKKARYLALAMPMMVLSAESKQKGLEWNAFIVIRF
jgi:hypothetical protein